MSGISLLLPVISCFLNSMSDTYINTHPSAAIVRDYLAGMTDDFFLRQARKIDCDIPERTCIAN